jgi:hypothetical protein
MRMSVRAGQDASANPGWPSTALVAGGWAGLDRLLPVPPALAGGDLLAVPGAAGRCQHWAGEPGSLDLAWGGGAPVPAGAAGGRPGRQQGYRPLWTEWEALALR